MTRVLRASGWLAFAVSLFACTRLLMELHRGFSEVPWRDLWAFANELPSYDGPEFRRTLWSCYWGHRIVLPRLFYLADARWFHLSNVPLTFMILACQLLEWAALLWIALRALGARGRPFVPLFAAVSLNLLFSPLQIENFIWGMKIDISLLYTGLFGAVLLFAMALEHERGRPVWMAGSVAAAAVSSYSMANGILVWPALCWQAFVMRRFRAVGLFAASGALVIGTYFVDYQRPQMGVPLSALIQRPFVEAGMMALFLAGPLSKESLIWSKAVGFVGLTLGLVFLCHAALRKPLDRWAGALSALLAFLLLTVVMIGVGRLDPAVVETNFAHGNDVLPSRYFAPCFLYWAVLFALGVQQAVSAGFSVTRWGAALAAAALALSFSLVRLPQELATGQAWADQFRVLDAIGGALLTGVNDQDYLQLLWPVMEERRALSKILEGRRLTIYAEDRAYWTGRPVSDFFRIAPDRCHGAAEVQDRVGGGLRLKGWVWDPRNASLPFEVLTVEPSGVVGGIGRSGISHRFVSAEVSRDAGWMAYVRPESSGLPLALYAVRAADRSACRFAELPAPKAISAR